MKIIKVYSLILALIMQGQSAFADGYVVLSEFEFNTKGEIVKGNISKKDMKTLGGVNSKCEKVGKKHGHHARVNCHRQKSFRFRQESIHAYRSYEATRSPLLPTKSQALGGCDPSSTKSALQQYKHLKCLAEDSKENISMAFMPKMLTESGMSLNDIEKLNRDNVEEHLTQAMQRLNSEMDIQKNLLQMIKDGKSMKEIEKQKGYKKYKKWIIPLYNSKLTEDGKKELYRSLKNLKKKKSRYKKYANHFLKNHKKHLGERFPDLISVLKARCRGKDNLKCHKEVASNFAYTAKKNVDYISTAAKKYVISNASVSQCAMLEDMKGKSCAEPANEFLGEWKKFVDNSGQDLAFRFDSSNADYDTLENKNFMATAFDKSHKKLSKKKKGKGQGCDPELEVCPPEEIAKALAGESSGADFNLYEGYLIGDYNYGNLGKQCSLRKLDILDPSSECAHNQQMFDQILKGQTGDKAEMFTRAYVTDFLLESGEFYKDLAKYATNRVMDSYMLTFLSDPAFSPRKCTNEDKESIKDLAYKMIQEDFTHVENLEGEEQNFSQAGNTCLGKFGVTGGDFAKITSNAVKMACLDENNLKKYCPSETTKKLLGDDHGKRSNFLEEDRKKRTQGLKETAKLVVEIDEMIEKVSNNFIKDVRYCRGEMKGEAPKCDPNIEGASQTYENRCLHVCSPGFPGNIKSSSNAELYYYYRQFSKKREDLLRENPELMEKVKVSPIKELRAYEYFAKNYYNDKCPKFQLDNAKFLICQEKGTAANCRQEAEKVVQVSCDEIVNEVAASSRRKVLNFMYQDHCKENDGAYKYGLGIALTNPKMLKDFIEHKKALGDPLSPVYGQIGCMAAKHARGKTDELKKTDDETNWALILQLAGAGLSIAAIPFTGGSSAAIALTLMGMGVSMTGTTMDLVKAKNKLASEERKFQACHGSTGAIADAEAALDSAEVGVLLEFAGAISDVGSLFKMYEVGSLKSLAKNDPDAALMVVDKMEQNVLKKLDDIEVDDAGNLVNKSDKAVAKSLNKKLDQVSELRGHVNTIAQSGKNGKIKVAKDYATGCNSGSTCLAVDDLKEGQKVRLKDGEVVILGQKVHSGKNGLTFCVEPGGCKQTITLSKNSDGNVDIANQLANYESAKKSGVAMEHISGDIDAGYLIRNNETHGISAADILSSGKLTKTQSKKLGELSKKAKKVKEDSGLNLDITPENLIWVSEVTSKKCKIAKKCDGGMWILASHKSAKKAAFEDPSVVKSTFFKGNEKGLKKFKTGAGEKSRKVAGDSTDSGETLAAKGSSSKDELLEMVDPALAEAIKKFSGKPNSKEHEELLNQMQAHLEKNGIDTIKINRVGRDIIEGKEVDYNFLRIVGVNERGKNKFNKLAKALDSNGKIDVVYDPFHLANRNALGQFDPETRKVFLSEESFLKLDFTEAVNQHELQHLADFQLAYERPSLLTMITPNKDEKKFFFFEKSLPGSKGTDGYGNHGYWTSEMSAHKRNAEGFFLEMEKAAKEAKKNGGKLKISKLTEDQLYFAKRGKQISVLSENVADFALEQIKNGKIDPSKINFKNSNLKYFKNENGMLELEVFIEGSMTVPGFKANFKVPELPFDEAEIAAYAKSRGMTVDEFKMEFVKLKFLEMKQTAQYYKELGDIALSYGKKVKKAKGNPDKILDLTADWRKARKIKKPDPVRSYLRADPEKVITEAKYFDPYHADQLVKNCLRHLNCKQVQDAMKKAKVGESSGLAPEEFYAAYNHAKYRKHKNKRKKRTSEEKNFDIAAANMFLDNPIDYVKKNKTAIDKKIAKSAESPLPKKRKKKKRKGLIGKLGDRLKGEKAVTHTAMLEASDAWAATVVTTRNGNKVSRQYPVNDEYMAYIDEMENHLKVNGIMTARRTKVNSDGVEYPYLEISAVKNDSKFNKLAEKVNGKYGTKIIVDPMELRNDRALGLYSPTRNQVFISESSVWDLKIADGVNRHELRHLADKELIDSRGVLEISVVPGFTGKKLPKSDGTGGYADGYFVTELTAHQQNTYDYFAQLRKMAKKQDPNSKFVIPDKLKDEFAFTQRNYDIAVMTEASAQQALVALNRGDGQYHVMNISMHPEGYPVLKVNFHGGKGIEDSIIMNIPLAHMKAKNSDEFAKIKDKLRKTAPTELYTSLVDMLETARYYKKWNKLAIETRGRMMTASTAGEILEIDKQWRRNRKVVAKKPEALDARNRDIPPEIKSMIKKTSYQNLEFVMDNCVRFNKCKKVSEAFDAAVTKGQKIDDGEFFTAYRAAHENGELKKFYQDPEGYHKAVTAGESSNRLAPTKISKEIDYDFDPSKVNVSLEYVFSLQDKGLDFFQSTKFSDICTKHANCEDLKGALKRYCKGNCDQEQAEMFMNSLYIATTKGQMKHLVKDPKKFVGRMAQKYNFDAFKASQARFEAAHALYDGSTGPALENYLKEVERHADFLGVIVLREEVTNDWGTYERIVFVADKDGAAFNKFAHGLQNKDSTLANKVVFDPVYLRNRGVRGSFRTGERTIYTSESAIKHLDPADGTNVHEAGHASDFAKLEERPVYGILMRPSDREKPLVSTRPNGYEGFMAISELRSTQSSVKTSISNMKEEAKKLKETDPVAMGHYIERASNMALRGYSISKMSYNHAKWALSQMEIPGQFRFILDNPPDMTRLNGMVMFKVEIKGVPGEFNDFELTFPIPESIGQSDEWVDENIMKLLTRRLNETKETAVYYMDWNYRVRMATTKMSESKDIASLLSQIDSYQVTTKGISKPPAMKRAESIGSAKPPKSKKSSGRSPASAHDSYDLAEKVDPALVPRSATKPKFVDGFSEHMKGEFGTGMLKVNGKTTSAPTISGGLHTADSLEDFLKNKRPDLVAKNGKTTDSEGALYAKSEKLPNGVIRMYFPRSAWHSKNWKGALGAAQTEGFHPQLLAKRDPNLISEWSDLEKYYHNKTKKNKDSGKEWSQMSVTNSKFPYAPKTIFPASWNTDKIEKAAEHIFQFGWSNDPPRKRFQLYEGIFDGVQMKVMYDSETKLIKTAFPSWEQINVPDGTLQMVDDEWIRTLASKE